MKTLICLKLDYGAGQASKTLLSHASLMQLFIGACNFSDCTCQHIPLFDFTIFKIHHAIHNTLCVFLQNMTSKEIL